MAKESIKARQRKREKMVEKYAEKRKALKEAGDYRALDLLPKNASPVRLKNRCQLTGRPRGYMALRIIKKHVSRYGIRGKNSWSKKSKLVKNNLLVTGWVIDKVSLDIALY
jgi:ribosomal protein S14